MIGLDANVLVRYIMQDHVRQSDLAARLIESRSQESPGFVALVVVVEVVWVLSSVFELERAQIVEVLQRILRARELLVENAETVWKALRAFGAANANFADCLIASSAAAFQCEKTLSFDRRAAKGAGMTLLGSEHDF
jgi:predicted nucleic-acid-binding protein